MTSPHSLGLLGEETALAYLSGRGYRLLERNYRCNLGEVDLIMLDGHILVFIEVNARRSERYGEPQEAVGSVKQARIRRLAEHYLLCKGREECQPRFDVVTVRFKKSGRHIVDHFIDAF